MAEPQIEQAMQTARQLCDAGRLADAQNVCHQLLAQHPRHAPALYLLGVIANQLGKNVQAIEFVEQAIRINDRIPQYHYAMGTFLSELGRPVDAIAAYRKAVELKPDFLQAYTNLSYSLRQNRQMDEAIHAAKMAVQIQPTALFPLINLGTALYSARRLTEAIDVLRQTIHLHPDSALAHNNLGNALKDQGQLDEAIKSFRLALQLDPAQPRVHSNLLHSLHFLPDFDGPRIYQEALAWAAQHATPVAGDIRPHENDPSPHRKLKIGYVSPDFREHSVARFVLPLISHHDRSSFEIHCFSNVLSPDETTARFRAMVDGWHDVGGLSDAQLSELIRRQKIDILVDLAGHTAGNRMMAFARKPAPIQVAWLGYPGTTGLGTVDYRLTDANADLPGLTDSLHTERLIRLPQTAWCYEPHTELVLAGRSDRDENHPIVFGSFNNIAKVNTFVLNQWAAILKRVPNSRLLLKASSLSSPFVQDRLRKALQAANVSPDRLDLRDATATPPEHLATYNQIDIALDTFPYTGVTTTCEALWMGVPVVTLAGQTHVTRVGTSLLTNLGLPELIAPNPDQFIQIATALALDRPRLRELHSTLRRRMEGSPLMDASSFARNVETAYHEIWQRWRLSLR